MLFTFILQQLFCTYNVFNSHFKVLIKDFEDFYVGTFYDLGSLISALHGCVHYIHDRYLKVFFYSIIKLSLLRPEN